MQGESESVTEQVYDPQVSPSNGLTAAIRRERLMAVFRFNRYSVLLTLFVAPIIAWFSSDFAPGHQMFGWWLAISAASLMRAVLGWAFFRDAEKHSGTQTWLRFYISFTLLSGICWGALALPVIDSPPDGRMVLFIILIAITAFNLFPNMPSLFASAALIVPISLSMLVGAHLELTVRPELVLLTVAVYSPLCLLAARRLSISFGETVGAGLEFKRLSEAADAASRAKSVFLANMSHEIRTPLNGVMGMAELLQGTSLNEEQRRYCQAIAASGQTLQGLIGDVLDMAKIEAGKIELETVEFEPESLAEEVAAAYREMARMRGTVLETELDPAASGRVAGDPTRLRQVLSNLLGNAVKFTDGGSITLSMTRLDSGAANDPIQLRFSVVDTGIGISSEVLGQLFQPFVQADSSTTRRYGGSGLGLVICQHMVELMDGSIHAESKPGRGTTVSFEIPFAAASSAAAPTPASEPAPAKAQRTAARVLVAEDNPVNQQVIRSMLRRLGASVTLVEDGQQAVQAVQNGRFDLVLMDCQMPVLDGYEATAQIRDAEPGTRIPIVALTANAFAEDRQRCLDADMDDYLAKPVTVANLAQMLSRWVTSS